MMRMRHRWAFFHISKTLTKRREEGGRVGKVKSHVACADKVARTRDNAIAKQQARGATKQQEDMGKRSACEMPNYCSATWFVHITLLSILQIMAVTASCSAEFFPVWHLTCFWISELGTGEVWTWNASTEERLQILTSRTSERVLQLWTAYQSCLLIVSASSISGTANILIYSFLPCYFNMWFLCSR